MRLLGLFPDQGVGGVAVKALGRFHDGLGEGRVRMHGQGDILGCGPHLDGKRPLGDEFTGPVSHDAHPEHTLGVGIDDQLGQAFGMVKGERTPGGGPREFGDLDRNSLCLGLRQSTPVWLHEYPCYSDCLSTVHALVGNGHQQSQSHPACRSRQELRPRILLQPSNVESGGESIHG